MPAGKVIDLTYDEKKKQYKLSIRPKNKNKNETFVFSEKDIPPETRDAVLKCKDFEQDIFIQKDQGRYSVKADFPLVVKIGDQAWSPFQEPICVGLSEGESRSVSHDGRSYLSLKKYDAPGKSDQTVTFYEEQLPDDVRDIVNPGGTQRPIVMIAPGENGRYQVKRAPLNRISLETCNENSKIVLTDKKSFLSLLEMQDLQLRGVRQGVEFNPDHSFRILDTDGIKSLQSSSSIVDFDEKTLGKEVHDRPKIRQGNSENSSWLISDKTGFLASMMDEALETQQPFTMLMEKGKIWAFPLQRTRHSQHTSKWERCDTGGGIFDPKHLGDAESKGIFRPLYGDTIYIPRHLRETEKFQTMLEEAKEKDYVFLYEWDTKTTRYGIAERRFIFKTVHDDKLVSSEEFKNLYKEGTYAALENMERGDTISLEPHDIGNFDAIKTDNSIDVSNVVNEMKKEAQETGQRFALKCVYPLCMELQDLVPRVQTQGNESWEDWQAGTGKFSSLHIDPNRGQEPDEASGIYSLQQGEGKAYLPRSIRNRPDFQKQFGKAKEDDHIVACKWEDGESLIFGSIPRSFSFKMHDSDETCSLTQLQEFLPDDMSKRLHSCEIGKSIEVSHDEISDTSKPLEVPLPAAIQATIQEAKTTMQPLQFARLKGGNIEIQPLKLRMRKDNTTTWDPVPNSQNDHRDPLSAYRWPVYAARHEHQLFDDGCIALRGGSDPAAPKIQLFIPDDQRKEIASELHQAWKTSQGNRPLSLWVEDGKIAEAQIAKSWKVGEAWHEDDGILTLSSAITPNARTTDKSPGR